MPVLSASHTFLRMTHLLRHNGRYEIIIKMKVRPLFLLTFTAESIIMTAYTAVGYYAADYGILPVSFLKILLMNEMSCQSAKTSHSIR